MRQVSAVHKPQPMSWCVSVSSILERAKFVASCVSTTLPIYQTVLHCKVSLNVVFIIKECPAHAKAPLRSVRISEAILPPYWNGWPRQTCVSRTAILGGARVSSDTLIQAFSSILFQFMCFFPPIFYPNSYGGVSESSQTPDTLLCFEVDKSPSMQRDCPQNLPRSVISVNKHPSTGLNSGAVCQCLHYHSKCNWLRIEKRSFINYHRY